MKCRRGKGREEGVSWPSVSEATATAELFQPVVLGRFLSLLPGVRRSTSPNHRMVQLTWLRESGETWG